MMVSGEEFVELMTTRTTNVGVVPDAIFVALNVNLVPPLYTASSQQ